MKEETDKKEFGKRAKEKKKNRGSRIKATSEDRMILFSRIMGNQPSCQLSHNPITALIVHTKTCHAAAH